jgi:tetratricopeptide (TPR) repeat protein
MKTRIVALSIVCIMAAILSLLRMYDRRYLSSEESVRELMYFPRAEAVRAVSAGNELLVADYLWLRMIQYYAYHRERDMKFQYLYPIIDKLTDLDPRFVYPYTFGALLLAHDARDTINSIGILDKAKRLNPNKWEFPYMKGFILYIFFKKFKEAAEEFIEASKLPGAIPSAKRYAAFIYRRMGDREISKSMWMDIYQNSKNTMEREVAKIYLKRFEMEEMLEKLQRAAEAYYTKNKRWPTSLYELIADSLIAEVPRKDPFGGYYYWAKDSNKVKCTSQRKFLK